MAQEAKRGVIYNFIEKDGGIKNKVLVVSAEHRREDNIISILMLGTKYTGKDCIEILLGEEKWFVHCGLVTYTSRTRLGEEVGKIDEETQRRITNNMAYQLGINENMDYKKLYEDILQKITEGKS